MLTLAELTGRIQPLDPVATQKMKTCIDGLLKPLGSLGRLETLACQLAGIYRTTELDIGRKEILVMAADHGVFDEGVAVTPKNVTAIQSLNITRGLTGVCALAAAAGVKVSVFDVGIDADPIPGVPDHKIARGCGNIARGPAMSRAQAESLIGLGAELAMQAVSRGVKVLGVGELGIANTTPAAAMVSVMTGRSPADVVGLGANLPSDRLAHKVDVVARAIEINQPDANDPIGVLAGIGGFELAAMTGVMLGAAAASVPVVLDGFLSYACALVACRLAPLVWHYLIPSHQSAEKGSMLALAYLDLKPFVQLEMRLGEGSGAAIAMQILDDAVAMVQRMGRLADDGIDLPAPR